MSTKTRNYQIDYKRYTFEAEDDWGDYDNGKHRQPFIVPKGNYRINNYWCTDGKRHSMPEHVAKWEYFNGEVPKGLEIDHIIPISKGGTNKLSNLRLLSHGDNNRNELTKQQRSETDMGKWLNREDQSKGVLQFTIEGNLVATWPSLHEAERHGYGRKEITKCCQGKQKAHKGYIWRYSLT